MPCSRSVPVCPCVHTNTRRARCTRTLHHVLKFTCVRHTVYYVVQYLASLQNIYRAPYAARASAARARLPLREASLGVGPVAVQISQISPPVDEEVSAAELPLPSPAEERARPLHSVGRQHREALDRERVQATRHPAYPRRAGLGPR